MSCRNCKTEPVYKYALCHNCYSYRNNQDCEMKDSKFCKICHYRFECLDGNLRHRIARSEVKIECGKHMIVEGIEYSRVKQGCVNCGNLGFQGDNYFCIANSSRGNKDKVKDLTKDQSDCEFWKFREQGDSLWEK